MSAHDLGRVAHAKAVFLIVDAFFTAHGSLLLSTFGAKQNIIAILESVVTRDLARQKIGLIKFAFQQSAPMNRHRYNHGL